MAKTHIYPTIIFEDIANKSPLLLKYNPIHKKVPVLVHNGKLISESLVILEYIDEMWKQTPLLPEDPFEKVMACFWAEFGDEKLMPSVWHVFLAHENEREEAIRPALENLKFIEKQLKGKKFFSGDEIGFLDLAMGWMANLISVLKDAIGLNIIDTEKFPFLSEWITNFSDVPSIKESWPPHDKLITKFIAMRAASAPM